MTNMRLLLCVLLLSSAACGRQEEMPSAPSNVTTGTSSTPTTPTTPNSSTPTPSGGSSEYTAASGLRFADAAGWREVPEGQRRKDIPQPDGTSITIHSNWFYRGSPDAPETLLSLGLTDISAADASLTLEAWTEKFKQERPGDESCEIVDLSVRRRAFCKAGAQYKGKDFQALMYRWIDGSKLVTVMYLFPKEPDRAAAEALIGTVTLAAR
jgi:hypothetical protein